MNSQNEELNALTKELLEVLDEDVLYITGILQRFNELRAAVIKRDQEGLGVLLEAIGNEKNGYETVEKKRQVLKGRLARVMGCDIKEMNLSRLCKNLGQGIRQTVLVRQKQLAELAGRVRSEHKATVLLLTECSRLNSLFLRSILGQGKPAVTYNAQGKMSWEIQNRLVSFKL